MLDYSYTLTNHSPCLCTVDSPDPYLAAIPILSETYPLVYPLPPDGHPFVVRFLIKLQPRSRGPFHFVVNSDLFTGVTSNDEYKVCRLEVTHIGENLPCQTKPGPIPTEQDSYKVTYGTENNPPTPHECGASATVSFKVEKDAKR